MSQLISFFSFTSVLICRYFHNLVKERSIAHWYLPAASWAWLIRVQSAVMLKLQKSIAANQIHYSQITKEVLIASSRLLRFVPC